MAKNHKSKPVQYIQPSHFVIVKNGKGDVVLRYKRWGRDTEWKPSKDPNEGIVMLTAVCILKYCTRVVY